MLSPCAILFSSFCYSFCCSHIPNSLPFSVHTYFMNFIANVFSLSCGISTFSCICNALLAVRTMKLNSQATSKLVTYTRHGVKNLLSCKLFNSNTLQFGFHPCQLTQRQNLSALQRTARLGDFPNKKQTPCSGGERIYIIWMTAVP